MHPIRAAARYERAIHSTAELLGKLRIEAMFVGKVAESAWLGGTVDRGSVDLVALMSAQQRNQLAMMASNRGFRVEREEIEQSEELDLVPLNFVDAEGDVRVHVLLASNALYGRMIAVSETARLEERELRVPRAEDLALLLVMAEDRDSARRMREMPGFDQSELDERLVSIGMREEVSRG